VTNARNLKKCVLWSVVTTTILILTMGTGYSGDVKLKTEGNMTEKAFDYLQQQIYDLQQQIDDLQQQINSIERTRGPADPEGPQGHSGPAGADGSQGPASPKGLVLTVH
jgi:type IV secretory pathway VirB9-like protein